MFCPKCGANLKDGAKFCQRCGAPAGGNGYASASDPVTDQRQVTEVRQTVQIPQRSDSFNTGNGQMKAVLMGAGIGLCILIVLGGVMFCVSKVRNFADHPEADVTVEQRDTSGDAGQGELPDEEISSKEFNKPETMNADEPALDTDEEQNKQELLPKESTYEVVREDISWMNARKSAEVKNGHLITITSQEEMDKAIRLAEDAGLKYVWIGGQTTHSGSVTKAEWITGEPMEYTKWYDGEPSGIDEDGAPESFMMMWKLKDEWTWNDQRNAPFEVVSYMDGSLGYIIEYEN